MGAPQTNWTNFRTPTVNVDVHVLQQARLRLEDIAETNPPTVLPCYLEDRVRCPSGDKEPSLRPQLPTHISFDAHLRHPHCRSFAAEIVLFHRARHIAESMCGRNLFFRKWFGFPVSFFGSVLANVLQDIEFPGPPRCLCFCDLQGRKIHFTKLQNFGVTVGVSTVARVTLDLPECQEP